MAFVPAPADEFGLDLVVGNREVGATGEVVVDQIVHGSQRPDGDVNRVAALCVDDGARGIHSLAHQVSSSVPPSVLVIVLR